MIKICTLNRSHNNFFVLELRYQTTCFKFDLVHGMSSATERSMDILSRLTFQEIAETRVTTDWGCPPSRLLLHKHVLQYFFNYNVLSRVPVDDSGYRRRRHVFGRPSPSPYLVPVYKVHVLGATVHRT